jgi:tRNA-dihydrouridine synthase
VAHDLAIPVMGSGDCIEPGQIVERLGSGVSGVLVGRGVLRNPWILAQAADLAAGRVPRHVTLSERGQFLLDYIDLLVNERVDESEGFRHLVVDGPRREAKGHERWVINKVRALCAWYWKGIVRVNSASTLQELCEIIEGFFLECAVTGVPAVS